jgi:hypothetical protein
MLNRHKPLATLEIKKRKNHARPGIGLAFLVALAILVSPGWVLAQDTPPGEDGTQHQVYLPLLQSAAGRPAPTGPDNPGQPRRYTVQPGDTLLTVAVELGIDLEAMACLISPDFTWEQPLVIGNSLDVPPYPFACHKVAPGETLAEIAGRYHVSPEAILADAWNQLTAEPTPGANLRVPLVASLEPVRAWPLTPGWSSSVTGSGVGGPVSTEAVSVPPDWPYGSGQFAWPVYGWLTQDYHLGHRAIDVAAPLGTPVTAADRGVVVRAGWSDIGYGLFVVIDHNIDYLTLYAHLSEIDVIEGQIVAQGQQIGKVGSTGNSTGPHLHFEIRDFGRLTDPLHLLPR